MQSNDDDMFPGDFIVDVAVLELDFHGFFASVDLANGPGKILPIRLFPSPHSGDLVADLET